MGVIDHLNKQFVGQEVQYHFTFDHHDAVKIDGEWVAEVKELLVNQEGLTIRPGARGPKFVELWVVGRRPGFYLLKLRTVTNKGRPLEDTDAIEVSEPPRSLVTQI